MNSHDIVITTRLEATAIIIGFCMASALPALLLIFG